MEKLSKRTWQFMAGGVLTLFVLVLVIKVFYLQDAVYPVKRNIRYGFTLQNKTNQLQKNVDFWVYAPVKQTSTQMAGHIDATLPFDVSIDSLGNQLLHFKIENLPPFGAKIISINAKVSLTDTPNRQTIQSRERYLASEKYMETDDKRLVQLASQFQADSKNNTAKNIYQWVNTNLEYAGYIKDDRGALYALQNRKGDCTEYMYLYNALSRIAGIPSRGVGGYVYAEDSILKPEDFHNWSEVYIDKKWHVVDAQNGVYMDKQSHYIAMRIIANKSNDEFATKNTHQFAASSENISVKMN